MAFGDKKTNPLDPPLETSIKNNMFRSFQIHINIQNKKKKKSKMSKKCRFQLK